MVDLYPVDGCLLTNRKYLACGLLARHLWHVLIGTTEPEGRGRLDALEAQQAAALWGPALVPREEILAALRELLDRQLLVAYGPPAPDFPAGGLYFMPGRFEHAGGRKFWRASRFQLPPLDLLEQFPEYLEGLRRIDARGQLVRVDDDGVRGRRYPQLVVTGSNADETGVKRPGVGVGVGVGVEGGEVLTPPVSKSEQGGVAPIPPTCYPGKPTKTQAGMLQKMAAERGTTLAQVVRKLRLPVPVVRDQVTALRQHLESLPRLSSRERADLDRQAARAATAARRDQLYGQLLELLPAEPELAQAHLADQDDQDQVALLRRLHQHLEREAERRGLFLPELLEDARGGALGDFGPLAMDDLPAVVRAVYACVPLVRPDHVAPLLAATATSQEV